MNTVEQDEGLQSKEVVSCYFIVRPNRKNYKLWLWNLQMERAKNCLHALKKWVSTYSQFLGSYSCTPMLIAGINNSY
jgi:hypothetical protein